MIRFYRIASCTQDGYSLVDYVLDPSVAAERAMSVARKLPRKEYAIVTQIDVYPRMSEVHEFLRVDGQA